MSKKVFLLIIVLFVTKLYAEECSFIAFNWIRQDQGKCNLETFQKAGQDRMIACSKSHHSHQNATLKRILGLLKNANENDVQTYYDLINNGAESPRSNEDISLFYSVYVASKLHNILMVKSESLMEEYRSGIGEQLQQSNFSHGTQSVEEAFKKAKPSKKLQASIIKNCRQANHEIKESFRDYLKMLKDELKGKDAVEKICHKLSYPCPN